MFILSMMSGEKFRITDDEAKDIAPIKKGEVFIKSIGSLLNMASRSALYAENHPDLVEERKNQMTGRLHDGSRVKKHFGVWVDADMQVPDDKGNYTPVRIDSQHYPEVAMDTVFTEQEYEQIKHLPREERLKLVTGERKQRQPSKLTQIGKLF